MKVGGQNQRNVFVKVRNIQDLLADGEAPYERRLNQPLDGPIIPFGAGVEFRGGLQKTNVDQI